MTMAADIMVTTTAGGLADPQTSRRWGAALGMVLAAHIGILVVAAQWQGVEATPPAPEMSIALDLAPLPVADTQEEPTPAKVAPAKPAQAEQPRPVAPKPQLLAEPEVPLPVPLAVPVITPEMPMPSPVVATDTSTAETSALASTAQGAAAAEHALAGSTSASANTHGRRSGTHDPAAAWRGRVLAHLDRHKRYPPAARHMKREGRVRVRMTLDRQGHVLDLAVERGARFPPFEKEALATVRRADPLPAPPAELTGSTIPLQVPIGFYLPES